MNLQENTHSISFPSSIIKPPGALLKDKKEPIRTRIRNQQIKVLLDQFNNTYFDSPSPSVSPLNTPVNSPLSSFASFTCISMQQRPPRKDDEGTSLLQSFLKLHSGDEVICPGKIKSYCEQISNLICRSKEILSLYSIELSMRTIKNSKSLGSLLKALIPEICFFPCEFFQKLQIQQLVISDEITPIGADSQDDITLYPNILDTEEKVRKQLFKLICHRIKINNPEIIKRWEEVETDNEFQYTNGSGIKMEEVFTALMKNSNHPLLKFQAQKLGKILSEYYPETFSEEKIRKQSKEKKKKYRVSFDATLN